MSSFGEMVAELECPTCGGGLRDLAPGHRFRCAEYYRARRRRSVLAALALLVLVAVVFLAFPAHAQVDPSKIQEGLVTAPLATVAFLEFLAIAYLFRELRKESAARFEDLARANESTMRVQVAASELARAALESMDVVEHLARRDER